MTMVEAALEYATRRWPVFPLEEHGKQPIGRLAPHGLKDATCDQEQINAWWDQAIDANIGIPTGIAFDVIDLDSDQAVERFRASCQLEGVDARQYPRAKTGKGRHIAVAVTGFGNKTRLLPGMDFRGQGGYIVAPPSVHASGEVYRWIVEPNGAVPQAPAWFLELLRRPGTTEALTLTTPPAANDPPPAYISAAVLAVVEQMRAAVEGERNDTLNRSAFSLGQMVGAGWISASSAELDLMAAARATGLDEKESRATIKSGLSTGSQDPRRYEPPLDLTQGLRVIQGRLQPAGSPELPEPPRGGAGAAPARYEGFDALIEPGPVWAAAVAETVPVIIRGWIVQGGIAMLVSDPKAGKTWIALELVTCVVTGQPVLGEYPVEQPGRVLYIATEGTREGTLNRLKAMALGKELEIEQVLNGIDFIWRKGVRLDDAGFLAWLGARAADYALVIVDVLGEAWGGEENKAHEVSELMRQVRKIADGGATIALLHHLSKQDATDSRSIWQRIRGSTAFSGAFDSGIGLERSASASRTKVSFQHRDDAPPNPFTFTWPEELVTGKEPITLDYQPLESDLREMQDIQGRILTFLGGSPGAGANDVATGLGGRKKNVLDALRGLVAAGLIGQRDVAFKRPDGRQAHRAGHFLDGAGGATQTALLALVPDSSGELVPGSQSAGGGGFLGGPPFLGEKGSTGTTSASTGTRDLDALGFSEDFWSQVEKTESCWLWRGRMDRDGYGRALNERTGESWFAYRYAWTSVWGPLADGLEVHHTCRNRACVNPDHLQALTPHLHQQLHKPDACPACGKVDYEPGANGGRACLNCGATW